MLNKSHVSTSLLSFHSHIPKQILAANAATFTYNPQPCPTQPHPAFLFKIRLNINNEFVSVFPKSDYPTIILSELFTCAIGATCCVY